MKTLVHFDVNGREPLGLWWVDSSGEPKSLYLQEEGPEAARGRVLVFSKENPDVEWVDWFHRLADRAPYFEVWGVYESNGLSPEEMFNSLRDSIQGT